MDTMKIYLTAIAADALSTAQVNFDTVSTFDDSETTTTTTTLNRLGSTSVSSTTNDATVLKMTPATANSAAAAKGAIGVKKGWLVAAGTTIFLLETDTTQQATIPAGTGNGGSSTRGVTLTGNNAVDAAAIATQANKDIATALGITMNAYHKGHSGATVSLILHEQTAAGADLGERYTATALTAASTTTRGTDGALVWSAHISDTVTLTVGTNTVTTSLGAAYSSAYASPYTGTVTTVGAIELALKSAWAHKYGTTGHASAAAIATLVGLNNGIIQIVALQQDSGGHDLDVSFSVGNSGTAVSSQTAANIDYVIGTTNASGDNATTATTTAKIGIIVTMESNSNTVDNTSTILDASVGASLTALTTDYTTNTAWSKKGLGTGQTVERTDVRSAEALVDAAASNAVAATKFNRVTWLG
jgi:hypothetical protein